MLFRCSCSVHILWEDQEYFSPSPHGRYLWKCFSKTSWRWTREAGGMSLRLFRPLPLSLCELEFLFCCKQWKYLLSSSFPPACHPSQAGNRVCSSPRDPVWLCVAYIWDLSPTACEVFCWDKSCDCATLAVDQRGTLGASSQLQEALWPICIGNIWVSCK